MKKNLILLSIAVITILFFTNCDLTKTEDTPVNMKDLEAPAGFKFNTTNQVSINLTSVNLQGNTVPNATFGIYKDDLADSTLTWNFRKVLTASTNENAIYEATISLPTSLDSIWVQSGIGFVRSFPIEITGNGQAEVNGVFPYYHYSPQGRGGSGRNNLDDFQFMTMWFVKHHDEELHYYYLAGNNQGEYNEGHINLTSKPGSNMDVKAFTISDDGVMYFYNLDDKYLYKILPSEIDSNSATPVNALQIGEMNGLDSGDSELNSLEFINGVLYGFGKKDETLYQINHNTAAYSAAFTISFPTRPNNPEITGLTCIGDTVYFLCKKGVSVSRPPHQDDGQIWRLDMITHNITHIITPNQNDLESLAGHPNGKLYLASHNKKWYISDPTVPNWAFLREPSPHIDIKDWDFYYQGEIEEPTDSDGDGIPDVDDAYPNDASRAFQSFTPSETEFATLMYEDLWPSMGDYDMNDLVLDYQICEITNAQHQMVEDSINFNLRASGAGYTLGFAIKFPSDYVLGDPVDPTFNLATLEASDNVIRFFNNQRTIFGVSGSEWINTTDEGLNVPSVEWTVTIPISSAKGAPRTISPWDFPPYNPFIYVNNTRSHEIHLLDYPPTAAMDSSLFDTGDDVSNSGTGSYFLTGNGLPWAVNVTEATDYPLETYQITEGFLHFADWVESSGEGYSDWYSNTGLGYRDNDCIYFPPQD
ncbi:MAG: LruC domain-containing protein [Candidatus Cloacimonadota bacterium]|nr:LruC domain-containing protein [Candidatus Cloacimonadota bacterium]